MNKLSAYDPISAAEEKILQAVLDGEPVYMDPDSKESYVRAKFLKEVLTCGETGFHRLRISGISLTGILDLEGTRVPVMIEVKNSHFDSAPVFSHAEVDRLSLRGSQVPGLTAVGLTCKGDLDLSENFVCRGTLELRSAVISGSLLLSDAVLLSREASSLLGSWMRVEGQFKASRLRTDGKVQLVGTRVGGMMSFWGAQLGATNKTSLDAERANIAETLFLKNGFTSEGAVDLSNAIIGGGLDIARANLGRGRYKRSLAAERISVTRNVSLNGASASGTIHLRSASIGNAVNLKGTHLNSDDLEFSVNLFRARASHLEFTFGSAPRSPIDLRGCEVVSLVESCAVRPPRVQQSDFMYRNFSTALEGSVVGALSWIDLDPAGYLPHAYDRLADAYRNAGRLPEARKIMISKERARTRAQPVNRRLLGWTLDILVGYGYQPWKALLWTGILTFLGGILFSLRPPVRLEGTPEELTLNPYLFALDVLMPSFISLRQEPFFLPTEGCQYFAWFLLIVMGWVLSISLVAGVTKALSKP